MPSLLQLNIFHKIITYGSKKLYCFQFLIDLEKNEYKNTTNSSNFTVYCIMT